MDGLRGMPKIFSLPIPLETKRTWSKGVSPRVGRGHKNCLKPLVSSSCLQFSSKEIWTVAAPLGPKLNSCGVK